MKAPRCLMPDARLPKGKALRGGCDPVGRPYVSASAMRAPQGLIGRVFRSASRRAARVSHGPRPQALKVSPARGVLPKLIVRHIVCKSR